MLAWLWNHTYTPKHTPRRFAPRLNMFKFCDKTACVNIKILRLSWLPVTFVLLGGYSIIIFLIRGLYTSVPFRRLFRNTTFESAFLSLYIAFFVLRNIAYSHVSCRFDYPQLMGWHMSGRGTCNILMWLYPQHNKGLEVTVDNNGISQSGNPVLLETRASIH